MIPYIKNIHINKLFHLQDLNISLSDEKFPHLIITGKNGSGKTVLLEAIASYLDIIKSDRDFKFLDYEKHKEYHLKKAVEQGLRDIDNLGPELQRSLNSAELWDDKLKQLKGKVELEFNDVVGMINHYNLNEFILAYYPADRKNEIIEPKNPLKPELKKQKKVKDSLVSELLKFLSDLKFQEALARNDGKEAEADVFKSWFENFKRVLRGIFDDEKLELDFHYQDYTFSIITEGKSFKFTELSDGFRAVLEIVADLILKMQTGKSISAEFNKPGIVLIDEVETHLHLQLQKSILPFLTSLFPNIQFLVTTHSPFVLNSIPNSTAYDLENRQPINDLTEYSAQALTEGYFRVSDESNYAKERLNQLRILLEKNSLDIDETKTAKGLIQEFKKIPEAVAPDIRSEFNEIINSNAINVRRLQQ